MRNDKAGNDDAKVKDGSSNTFEVVDDNQINKPDAVGETRAANMIRLKRSHKDDYQNSPHEIGHSLQAEHESTSSGSIMNEGNVGSSGLYPNNVQDIINRALNLNNSQPHRISTHGNLPKGKVKDKPN
jgi:hypothetical protein